jgi:hypothetical protein
MHVLKTKGFSRHGPRRGPGQGLGYKQGHRRGVGQFPVAAISWRYRVSSTYTKWCYQFIAPVIKLPEEQYFFYVGSTTYTVLKTF